MTLVANARSGGTDASGAVAAALRARGAGVAVLDVGAVEAAAEDDPERLVVAGGDGSIGPAAAVAARAGVPLAVVATGTANDFARALGLPREVGAACALAADPDASTRAIELAWAGERPFVNAASCGLSVLAARRAAPLKPRLGPLAYAAGALRAGLTGRAVAATVRCDGRVVHDGPAWQVVVGATGAFGAGSGLEEADPGDGLLDVVAVGAGSRAALVRRAWGLRRGRGARQPGVAHARGARIEVAVAPGTRWNVDGEVCALGPAAFRAQAGAVEVVVG